MQSRLTGTNRNQEYREWSASQIEDAQKTTEATEDMHFINGDWVGFFP